MSPDPIELLWMVGASIACALTFPEIAVRLAGLN